MQEKISFKEAVEAVKQGHLATCELWSNEKFIFLQEGGSLTVGDALLIGNAPDSVKAFLNLLLLKGFNKDTPIVFEGFVCQMCFAVNKPIVVTPYAVLEEEEKALWWITW